MKPPRFPLRGVALALAATSVLSACIVEPVPPPPPRYVAPPRQVVYVPEPAEPVVSVYVEPPLYQPPPIAVSWAPPPMLVEAPPPQPYPDAVWTGGYWVWQERWVWSAGRWSAPPRPRFLWVEPYYEHRGDVVIFVPGFWSPPEVRFVPPPPGLSISLSVGIGGSYSGRPPMGPQGVFVPPPPGSRPGLIVPAPIGTPPAVVVSAPPVVAIGMRIRGNTTINDSHINNVNNVNNVTNVNNITNVTNVTVIAPPGATANGQAFQSTVPARAHLAAGLPPMVRATAPAPSSGTSIPSYVAGRPVASLPPPQRVNGAPNAGARPEPGMPPNAGGSRPEFSPPPRQQPATAQLAPPAPPMQPMQPLRPVQRQPLEDASQQRAPGRPPAANEAVARPAPGYPAMAAPPSPGAQPAFSPDPRRRDASIHNNPDARQPHVNADHVKKDKEKDKGEEKKERKEHDGERQ